MSIIQSKKTLEEDTKSLTDKTHNMEATFI